ncbi:MAG: CinA family protein [Porticoccaceae bacterium]|nr:CinA family protein [Porticoccaceae bacterium]
MNNKSQNSQPTLDNLGAKVGELLSSKSQTVAVAESSTGGLISAALLAIPGASNYFRAGSVVYTRQAWKALLNSSLDIASGKALSEATALHLAKTIRTQLDTDWGIGEIGAAGPTGTRYGDPAGLTCIAVVGPGVEKAIVLKTGEDDRAANMWAFTQAALDLLEDSLEG